MLHMPAPTRIYGFDARVISDHFPGIGRYAWNLLQQLIAHLEPNERLAVLYDPGARSSRHPISALKQRAPQNVEWIATSTSVFSLRNVLLKPSAAWSAVHYPYYMRPLVSNVQSITTLHDAIPFLYPRYFPSLHTRLVIWLFHYFSVQRSRRVILVSSHALSELTQRFPRLQQRGVVIHSAADPIFRPLPTIEASAKLEPRFGVLPPFCLYLASNKPHKNLPRLVEAWRVVADALGEQTPLLLVAGHQDPRYPEAQRRAQVLGLGRWVRFVGAVSDEEAAALYSSCLLFVYPSLHEGFGLTPLEAMACGAPVACSNTSSLPEVVGDAALLFDPTSVDDIARACLTALRDEALRARLRTASLQQAARFSWERAAQQTLAVYREVAEARS